jgi:hypothetical protein
METDHIDIQGTGYSQAQVVGNMQHDPEVCKLTNEWDKM